MQFLFNLGQGNLRPNISLLFAFAILSFVGIQQAHAQIDISIDVFQRTISSGDPISVSPNPVVSNAKVEHNPEISISTLTILDENASVVAVIDVSPGGHYHVQLPPGLTHWVFETNVGVISEQVMISG